MKGSDNYVGIAVQCTVCRMTKVPHGRSAPLFRTYCDSDCPGYDTDPLPGCLWPGETAEDFGYPCCSRATRPLTEEDAAQT